MCAVIGNLIEVLARLLRVASNFSATLELIDRENYIVINRSIYFISNLIESEQSLERKLSINYYKKMNREEGLKYFIEFYERNIVWKISKIRDKKFDKIIKEEI